MANHPVQDRHALVLGATGGIGGELARRLRDAHWQVRALKRGAGVAEDRRDGLTWIRGDAMNRGEVLAAAQGCQLIVHAVNPPGYRRWADEVLPMVDNTIAAAVAERATVVLPGTVYNYGPDAFPLIAEEAPQSPQTRKGKIRVALEQRLQAATTRGARAIVVRAGDYFGPGAGNTWFAQGLVRPHAPLKRIASPGKPGVGHQWAYLPDVARIMLELIARREALAPFSSYHVEGHWDADGRQMIDAIRRVARRHGLDPKTGAFPWWLTRLASPFMPTLRELQEMRYLWREPVRLDGSRLRELLGHKPRTPLEEAVEATLAGLGCLPAPSQAAPAH